MDKNFDQILDQIDRETSEAGDGEYSVVLAAAFAFAAQVMAQRRELKLTQTQLGQRCGLKQSEISRIEHGEANLTLGRIAKLSSALGGYEFTISAEPIAA